MNFHVGRMREVADDLQQRLDIAHRIMASQGMALAQCYAAFELAKEAIAWYGGEHYEGADGVTVSERINDAMDEIMS